MFFNNNKKIVIIIIIIIMIMIMMMMMMMMMMMIIIITRINIRIRIRREIYLNIRKLLSRYIAKFRADFLHSRYTVLCNKRISGQNPAVVTMLDPSPQPFFPCSCLLGGHLCVLDLLKVQHIFDNKLDTLASSSFQ